MLAYACAVASFAVVAVILYYCNLPGEYDDRCSDDDEEYYTDDESEYEISLVIKDDDDEEAPYPRLTVRKDSEEDFGFSMV